MNQSPIQCEDANPGQHATRNTVANGQDQIRSPQRICGGQREGDSKGPSANLWGFVTKQ